MALDQITVHDAGVTGGQSRGYSQRPLDARHVRRVLGDDGVAVPGQIQNPVLAAAAAGILVDGDRGLPGRVAGSDVTNRGGGEGKGAQGRDERDQSR